jgi:hypothetical protein
MVAEAKSLGDSAKAVASAVGDQKPASALVTQLVNQASKFQNTLSSTAAASPVQGQWSGISAKVATIAAAFQQK